MKKKSLGKIKNIARALKHRNFRLFYFGQSISLIGTWMQRIAMGWLVYRITGSPFLLGAIGFLSHIPALFLSPIAGVLADRFNRHKLIILTQAAAMIQAAILYILIFSNIIQVWSLAALSLLLGFINAFDMPIRQSFVSEMVDNKNDLGNAIALNSFMVNGAKLIGPSAAGIIIALAGEKTCFFINALSYIPVIISLLLMKITKRKLPGGKINFFHTIKEGFLYTSSSVPIRSILILFALINFFGMPFMTLMPVFAKDILKGGPSAMGFLMGGVGIGALFGALYLASKKSVAGLENKLPFAMILFSTGLIAFSFSRNIYTSIALMLITGFGQMVEMASSNTLIQTIVEDNKRGRVMSIYTMAFRGMFPIGSLLAGYVSEKIGAPKTVFISGILCIISAAAFYRKLPKINREINPIYEKLGILPEIAKGIQGAVNPPRIESKE